MARLRSARLNGARAARAAAAITAIPLGLLGAGTALAAPSHLSHGSHGTGASFTVARLASGDKLTHTFTPAGSAKTRTEHLTSPDDITIRRHDLYVTFQNGVDPQGQASSDGNRDSTIAEFTPGGREVRQWDLIGKCDGLTADQETGLVIATVNEDAHSSLYTIDPGARPGHQVQHYAYSQQPLPHHGGTDAISVYRGRLLISASAPGTTGAAAPDPAYPAVYVVTLKPRGHIAQIQALFYDDARATVAGAGSRAGQSVSLALTDPDSNEVVPAAAPRFRGDFMLTSQGDKEQIYVSRAGTRQQALAVLSLSQSVDDTAWATGWGGRLYATDNSGDTVDAVTGPFRPGQAFEAVTPCDAGNAPPACPAPGFPANYLGLLNMSTGHISPVALHGPALEPQGMIFVSR